MLLKMYFFHLVVEQDRAAWFQQVLIHKGQDADVVLRSHRGGNNGVVVIDNFLQSADRHGGPTQVVNL